MNKFFIPPDTAQIVPLIGSALVLISVDLSERTGKCKIFETVEEARLWVHDVSEKQNPEWHKDNCEYCRTGFGL